MEKYIHYCWFGDKPLPKLAKKCINSWKKYLPDYKIIKWSEDNVDLSECPFIKGAYANKKWAFVADYARCKALKEMGGIYFDTDMEVLKDITDLLEKDTFLGMEDTGYVAVGVWYEKEKNAFLPTELLKKYQSFKSFDIDNITKISIPILISEILEKQGLIVGLTEIQLLSNNITIYPREYFYPYSYNRDNNIFTDKTCMIHYYDASWIPIKEKIENNMVRRLGRKRTYKVLNMYRKGKDTIRKIGKTVLFPVVLYKNNKRQKKLIIEEKYVNRIEKTITKIKELNTNEIDYITFYNSEWLGVTSDT